jgi:uncharacterized cupredoxin-like copper-binding protein
MRSLGIPSFRRFGVVFFVCLVVVGTGVAGLSFAGVVGPRATAVTNINVSATEFNFDMSADSAPAGTVIFHVTNAGTESHDFAIAGQKTPTLDPGQTAALTLELTAGLYVYACTIGEHASFGMQGGFTVTGSAATSTATTTTTTPAPPPTPVANVGVVATEFKFILTGTKNTVHKTYKTVKVKYRVKVNGKFIKVHGKFIKVHGKFIKVHGKLFVKVNGKLVKVQSKYVTKTKTVRKLVKTTTTRTVPHGLVRFQFTNNGHISHNFVIGTQQTLVLGPGKSQVLDVTLDKKSYTYICSIEGHAAAGMRGTLVVT